MEFIKLDNGEYFGNFNTRYEILNDTMILSCHINNQCLTYNYLRKDNQFINEDDSNNIFEIIDSHDNTIIMIDNESIPFELKKLTNIHKLLLWLGYEI
jgi:hypothetical protein